MDNQTLITELVLLGFTTDPKINIALFVLFLVIYMVTIAGNCLIILMIIINHHLHKPMYFFLCMLSFLDLGYSSTALPKLLTELLSSERTISISACVIQMYVILLVEGSECLLAVMAYDRYVAICQPLHYHVLMRWGNCYRLVGLIFMITFMLTILPSIFTPVTLCYNRINHFMCEILAVLKLACDDNISNNELVIFSISFLSLLLPLMLILLSYCFIISSVLKIRSAGRSKAFSTCTSHLAVVALYFGTVMLMYFGPSSMYSTDQEKYSSIFYVIVSPMLNPLIYSLNNREVKDAFKKVLTKLNAQ